MHRDSRSARRAASRRERPAQTPAICGAALLSLGIFGLAGCGKDRASTASKEGIVSLSKAAAAATAKPEAAPAPRADGPRLGSISMSTAIYAEPSRRSAKIGYLRAGGTVARGDKPVAQNDCQGGWFRVSPEGYVCVGEDATLDLKHPLLRALSRRPDLSKPMPYTYAFVRAVAPNYYRVPTKAEQHQFEMSLAKHLKSFKRHHEKWNEIKVGANDVPLDDRGVAIGLPPESPPELTEAEKFGGGDDDSIPWFFQGGRKIANIASFKVPDYAVITNRIARKAGLALLDSFMGEGDRRLALTTDARLVPTSKLKPARGSTFHGIDMGKGWELPVAFVVRESASFYDPTEKGFRREGPLEFHSALGLTGRARRVGSERYLETKTGQWAKQRDLAVAYKPQDLPWFAKGKRKWIDVSILGQTLVLYEGPTPVFVTAVATGRDGLDDPKTTYSTVRGTFRIRDKHVTTTMDSHESGNKFELRDVPWVQYFEHGYAIHAAFWHDDFGRPRSHGCVNLSPIDARRVFMWTDPPVPPEWHGVSANEKTGEGTLVHIHP